VNSTNGDTLTINNNIQALEIRNMNIARSTTTYDVIEVSYAK
jgi:hypothetical protein